MASPKFIPPTGGGYNRAQTLLARYQSNFDQRWAEAQKAVDEAQTYALKTWEAQSSAAATRLREAQREREDAEAEKLRLESMLNTYKSAALGRSVGMLGANQGGVSGGSSSGSSTAGRVDATNAARGQLLETQKDLDERAAPNIALLGGSPDVAKAFVLAEGGNISDARDYLMQAAESGLSTVNGKVDPKAASDELGKLWSKLSDENFKVLAPALLQASESYETAISSGEKVTKRVAAPKFTKAEVESVQGEDQQHIDKIQRRIDEAQGKIDAAAKKVQTATDAYTTTLSEPPKYSDRIDRSRLEYGSKFGSVRAPGEVVPALVSRAKQTMGLPVKKPVASIWDHLDDLLRREPRYSNEEYRNAVHFLPANPPEPPKTTGAAEPVTPLNSVLPPASTVQAPLDPVKPKDAFEEYLKPTDDFEEYLLRDWSNEPAPAPIDYDTDLEMDTIPADPGDMSGATGGARSRALATMQGVVSRRKKVTRG